MPLANPSDTTVRAEPPRTARTVLVLGPPRSGTTLLGWLLARDGHSLSLSEAFLARSVMPHWKLHRLLMRLARRARLARLRPPADSSEPGYMGYLRRLARDSGYPLLVLKETYREAGMPPAWSNEAQLDRLLDHVDATLTLIRHPADVAASSIRLFRPMTGLAGRFSHWRWPTLPWFANRDAVVDWAARNWLAYVEWLDRRRLEPLPYERFVAAPAAEWPAVARLLGLPPESAVLDDTSPRRAFGGVGDPGVLRRPRPIDRLAVGRGSGLTAAQRARVREICGPAAARFDYA